MFQPWVITMLQFFLGVQAALCAASAAHSPPFQPDIAVSAIAASRDRQPLYSPEALRAHTSGTQNDTSSTPNTVARSQRLTTATRAVGKEESDEQRSTLNHVVARGQPELNTIRTQHI